MSVCTHKSHAAFLHSPEYYTEVMKVKSKLMTALSSLKVHSDNTILSDLEAAILRSTDRREDAPIDNKYVHQIHFLVSNAPGSISYLARQISRRLETTRNSVVALKTLVLLHRLLRGGNRYFEQDLRSACSSRDLHIDLHRLSELSPDPFIVKYAMFLEERVWWVINQAGKLEPTSTPSSSELCRLSKCQGFLDLVIDCSPGVMSRSNQVGQLALSIVLRESFRVYETFCEGVEVTVGSSLADLEKPARVLALDILRKACTQTPRLHEFYEGCKRSLVSKSLDYPTVQIVTTAMILSMEDLMNGGQQGREESEDTFSERLETKMSTVWVEFDGDDRSENSSFSIGELDDRLADVLLVEGENSTKLSRMEWL